MLKLQEQIKISINNVQHTFPANVLLSTALMSLGYSVDENSANANGIAVALNQTFVPKTDFATTVLRQSDEVDVVQAINGG